MSRLRASLIAVAVAAGLLALAVAALYGLVRLSWFERQAAVRVSDALGWPVTLGDLSVAYFPLPRLEIEGLRIPAQPAVEGEPLLEIGHVSVTVPWRLLAGLGGHVTRLELRAPRLHLARDPAGRGNWQALAGHLATLGGAGQTTFSVGEFAVVDGGLDYVWGDGRLVVTGIQLAARDLRPGEAFPLELRLAGESAGRTFHVALAGRAMLDPEREVYAADELTVDGWVGGDGLPLSGIEWDAVAGALHADLAAGRTFLRDLRLGALGVALQASGELTQQAEANSLVFLVEAGPFSPRAVAARLERPLPATTDPTALSHAAFTARGTWDGAGLALGALSGELDDSRFSGSAVLPAGDAAPRLRLVVDTLDLDRYLPPGAGVPAQDDGLQSAVAGLRDTLQELDVDAEVTLGEACAAGVRARDLTLRLQPLAGGVGTAGDGAQRAGAVPRGQAGR